MLSAISKALNDAQFSSDEKLLLCVLGDSADWETAETWPSIETICYRSALSESTVRRVIRRLIEKRAIEVVARQDRSGRSTSNCYRMLIVAPGEKIMRAAKDKRQMGRRWEGVSVTPSQGGGCQCDRGEGVRLRGVEGVRLGGVLYESARMNLSLESKEEVDSHESPTRASEGRVEKKVIKEEFDRFYQQFPNKKNPGRAEIAYFRARKTATAAEILDGLARAIGSVEWAAVDTDGRPWIPHPATWLNDKGWKSEYKPLGTASGNDAALAAFLKRGPTLKPDQDGGK